ncbi:MAG: TM2 domain-containing protein [Bacteroidota bacterium]|nr:TM2 domain-containing protein [Bacteroidota bacterium]
MTLENQTIQTETKQKSEKGFIPTVLLCFFLGGFGIHRFYVGKVGTGIAMLLTLGGLGIWTIIDFVRIVTGNFKDKDGLEIKS